MNLLTLQRKTAIVDKEGMPTEWFSRYEQQGFTGVITTAKLTAGGTNGFLTFFNGKIVGVQDAT